jgi:hypothetical protein
MSTATAVLEGQSSSTERWYRMAAPVEVQSPPRFHLLTGAVSIASDTDDEAVGYVYQSDEDIEIL